MRNVNGPSDSRYGLFQRQRKYVFGVQPVAFLACKNRGGAHRGQREIGGGQGLRCI